MKKRITLILFGKKKFFTIVLMLFSILSFAQLPFTRSTFNGTFSPIYSGTSAGSGSVSTAVGDDVTQNNLPIGFTFNYLGTTYTTIGVSTNGWASFVSTLTSAQNGNMNLFSTSGPNLSLGPWWDDLASDSIVYKKTGLPGSQIFTIQWNAKSYYFTSTQLIKFQLKLYEGTNVIEFHYAPITLGATNTSESASIGIEGATGGNGNWLDAVTGSAFVGQGFLNSTTKWPTKYYRFTPGVPTALAGGTYNVGTGQTYPTIDQAIADINHRGITGAVTFALTQPVYDLTPTNGNNIFPVFIGPVVGASATNSILIQPALGTSTIAYDGATSGNGANGFSTSAFGNTSEPTFGLVGANNVTFNNLYLTVGTNTLVDLGIALINQSAALGTSSCTVKNVTVSLNRANNSSLAFETRLPTTPTIAAGSNSNNRFTDFVITNVNRGINFLGNSAFPDQNNLISTSSATVFNTIGATTPDDIGNVGNPTGGSYGIQVSNQASITINNTIVRNVSINASAVATGLILTRLHGLNNKIYNNKIYNIKNYSNTGATNIISGIMVEVSSTLPANDVRIYNNFISGITSAYTGTASASRQISGIYAQWMGLGAANSTLNIDFNNVSIDGSSSPNVSSTALEVGTVTGPVINVRNNIFANFTGSQVAPAKHLTWYAPSTTLLGNTGSLSNYNDLYVANTTQGFIGTGSTTDYATLANWQAAYVGQNVNSVSFSPAYVNNTNDLHVTSLLLNGAGNSTGIGWVTTDIDNNLRGATPDIGADEFGACTTVNGGTISPASPTICAGQSITLNNTSATFGGGISYAWQTATAAAGPFTNVAVGTGSNTTGYNTGTLTAGIYYYILKTTCSASTLTANSTNTVTLLVVGLPTIGVSAPTNTFCSPLGAPVVLTATGSATYTWAPVASLSSSSGATVNASPTTNTTYTVTGVNATGCLNFATITLSVNVPSALPSISISPSTYTYCAPGGSSITLTASGASTYNWAPAASLSSSTGTSVIATPTAATVYSVTGTNSVGCSNTVIYNFNVSPSATLDSLSISPSASICSGSSASLVAYGANSTSTCQATYANGTFGGDYISSVTLSTLTNTSVGAPAPYYTLYTTSVTTTTLTAGNTYTLFLVAGTYNLNDLAAWIDYNQNGTLDPTEKLGEVDDHGASPAIASIVFTVPVTALNGSNVRFRVREMDHAGVNDMHPCATQSSWGETEDYIITIVGGITPSFSYSWSPSTFLGSTSSASTIASNATLSTVYTISVTNVFGCSGLFTKTLTVKPTPILSITGNTALCTGQSTSLTASGAPTYTWNTSATTSSIAITPATTTTYSVVSTNSLGCSGTASTIVTVNNYPSLIFVTASTVVCSGQTSTIVAGGASTYTWDNGATTSSITPTPTLNTTYTVTGANGSCTSSLTTSVTVNPLPIVNLTANSYSSCLNGANIGLNGSPSGGTYSGTNVTGVLFTPGAVAGTFTPTYAYTNTVTGCSKTASISIIVSPCAGITANTNNFNTLRAYPNPNSGVFTIEFANGAEKTIQISDLTGRIVLEFATIEDVFNVNITALANGVYYVKVQSANSVNDVFKLIKQ